MKRSLCLIMALLVLLAGCQKTPTVTTATPGETTVPPETSLSPETVPEETLQFLRENLPVMDGSTSLIPLEAGIRAALFGKSTEEATLDVSHSSTWGSFYNLLEGSAELVFSCPLSQMQYDIAKEYGVTLELVPIAMEGFVFVVNAQNPVDTLTQQQIKDIYSGKITNWSQVGGNDEEIIPYQRNTESGSQNYMLEFMGDTPLMDAPIEMRPDSMEGLMDVVAVNDNASGAIGYSVYAYAADMYGNGNEIKFIQVDGVAPSKATFASGEYPLLGKNYAVFSADQPEGGSVRTLVDWMLSFQGQTAIAQAGYVTVMDVGFDYREATLTKYQGTGTGPAAIAPDTFRYTLGHTMGSEWGDYTELYLTLDVVTLADGTKTYRMTHLANETLQQEINAFIDAQLYWLPGAIGTVGELVEGYNAGKEYPFCSITAPLGFYNCKPEDMDWSCIVTGSNGYLSVAITICYTDPMGTGYTHHFKTQTATWDLITGRRLAPEELFCQGVDIDQVLNTCLTQYSQSPQGEFRQYPDMKTEFAGLTEGGWHLTHDAIYFDRDNPYFVHGVRIPLDELPLGTLACEVPRDFSDCLTGNAAQSIRRFRTGQRDVYYTYEAEGLVGCGFLKEDTHPNAAAINQRVRNYLNTYFTEDAILSYYDSIGLGDEHVELWMLDWDLTVWGEKYLIFQGNSPSCYVESEERIVGYPIPPLLMYDLETGEQLQWQDLLTANWRENALLADGWTNDPVDLSLADDLTCTWLYQESEGELFLSLTDWEHDYFLTVPGEYIAY